MLALVVFTLHRGVNKSYQLISQTTRPLEVRHICD